jgi:phosphoglycolate phosphatase-like HAD superfamily hydrolase
MQGVGMIRNIIWDVDGTLFDTYPLIAQAFRLAINDLGADAPLDWIESLARISFRFCATALAEKCHHESDLILKHFKDHYARIPALDSPPFPGVAALCQMIVLQGGKNVIVTHRSRKGTEELLAAHHMAASFSDLIGSDAGYPRKPDPAAFKAILRHNDLDKNETITVGDRDIDIQAGQAAGVFSCLFGQPSREIKPDLVVHDFAELHQFIVNCNH